MPMIRLLIMLFCLATIPVAISHGADFSPEGGDIVIKADRMDHDLPNDIFNASSNVTILWEGMTLTADQASYSRKTGIMTATGNIHMTKNGDTLQGQKFTIDLATG